MDERTRRVREQTFLEAAELAGNLIVDLRSQAEQLPPEVHSMRVTPIVKLKRALELKARRLRPAARS